jgi:hypothetical protein
MPEPTAAELHQRLEALQLQLRLLEAEASQLDGKRGAAVLEGGNTLAQLHQRVAEVERDQRDLTAGLATLGPQLDAARERERQQAHDELRETGAQLCQQRLQAAADVDRALMALQAAAVRWRGLGDALGPIRNELGVPDGAIAMGTSALEDGEAMSRALQAMAPAVARLLGLRLDEARRPLVHADGAGRLAVRLQQRPRHGRAGTPRAA